VLDPDAKLEAIALYNKACDFLISSYVLLRQAAYVESVALARLSIETCCVGMHVSLDPKAFSQFRKSSFKEFKATKSVSFARKHIDFIGAIWGALSAIGVHPNWHMHGAKHDVSEGYSVKIGERTINEYQDKATLLLISTIAGFIMRAIEISLLEPVNGDPKILRIPGTDKVRDAHASILINDRFYALQALVSEKGMKTI
jgi:hypothetical protein